MNEMDDTVLTSRIIIFFLITSFCVVTIFAIVCIECPPMKQTFLPRDLCMVLRRRRNIRKSLCALSLVPEPSKAIAPHHTTPVRRTAHSLLGEFLAAVVAKHRNESCMAI